MKEDRAKVTVSGIDIPFIDLMELLIKLVLAAIPATIVLSFVLTGVFLLIFVALPASVGWK